MVYSFAHKLSYVIFSQNLIQTQTLQVIYLRTSKIRFKESFRLRLTSWATLSSYKPSRRFKGSCLLITLSNCTWKSSISKSKEQWKWSYCLCRRLPLLFWIYQMTTSWLQSKFHLQSSTTLRSSWVDRPSLTASPLRTSYSCSLSARTSSARVQLRGIRRPQSSQMERMALSKWVSVTPSWAYLTRKIQSIMKDLRRSNKSTSAKKWRPRI